MTTKNRKTLFQRLKRSLEEGIAHVEGERKLRTVEVPEPPPDIDGATLAKMRLQAAMSQAIFAKLLNVSIKTLQSWEQGTRRPSEAARRLIQVFSEQPALFCRIAGLPEICLKGIQVKQHGKGRRKIVMGKR